MHVRLHDRPAWPNNIIYEERRAVCRGRSISRRSPTTRRFPPEKEAAGYGRNSKGDSPFGGHWSPAPAGGCHIDRVDRTPSITTGRCCSDPLVARAHVSARLASPFLPARRYLGPISLQDLPIFRSQGIRAASHAWMLIDRSIAVVRVACSCLTRVLYSSTSTPSGGGFFQHAAGRRSDLE